MLRRFRGIKPTHLWHRTSLKDVKYVLNRRLTAVENWEQREKRDFLQLVAIVIASSIGVLYSYGKISPAKTLTTIIPEPCKTIKDAEIAATQQKCPKVEVKPPCPKEKEKTKPKPCSK